MVRTREFRDAEALENYVEENRYQISTNIVDTLLDNMPIEVPLLCMRWVNLEEGLEYDIECLPEDVEGTLLDNLSIMEEHEDYERCARIKEALNK